MSELPVGHVIMPVLGAPELTEAAIADVLAQSVPIRLLIINQGVDDDFRRRLERIAEQESDRVLLWSHEPRLPSLAATWNRALSFVWQVGGLEALVVNNDVRLHPHTYRCLRRVIEASEREAFFVTAVGVTGEQFAETPEEIYDEYWWASAIHGRPLFSTGGPDFSCFMLTRGAHEAFPFDAGFCPAYCEDLDMHRRYMLADAGTRIFSINLPFHHVDHGSGTLKSMSAEQKAAHERRIGQAREYYARKWGGPVNQERYTIPFDEATAQDGVTTPELQRLVQQGLTTEEEAAHGQAVDRSPLGQPTAAILGEVPER